MTYSIRNDLVKRLEKCGRMSETLDDVLERAISHLETCNCDKCSERYD